MKKPRLSATLVSGRLAVLSRAFMTFFFRARIRTWYPGSALEDLTIVDKSSTEFKKSVKYTLFLRGADGKRKNMVLRGNIPSLDTTEEARTAMEAMRAIWRSGDATMRESITRPLDFDEHLRMLLYESVPGTPLTAFLGKGRGLMKREITTSAIWLARLHQKKISAGPSRSMRHEKKEIWYFGMNYRRYYPACDELTRKLFTTYVKRRQALDAAIRKNSILIHGDYNPNNILVDRPSSRQFIIDFGNARNYDPMSDYANALVQLELIAWQKKLSLTTMKMMVGTFRRAYERQNPLKGTMRARHKLFLAWWSFQTLSYTLSLDFVTHKTPMIQQSLRRASRALS